MIIFLPKRFNKIFAAALLILTLSISLSHAQIIITIAGSDTTAYVGDKRPATSAGLNFPTGVFADGSGNVYIADQLHNVVRKVDTSGIITTVAGNGISGDIGDNGPATSAELSWPIGLYVDGSGNIYISENTGCRVRKVDTSGIITTVAGNGNKGYYGDNEPATSVDLNSPSSLCKDRFGNLYIADWQNNRVRKVDTLGIITTVAGNGTSGFSGDNGPATDAELSWPFGVYIDGSGNMYIADWNNNRVRKVDISGIITTVAGNGTPGYNGDSIPATTAELDGACGVWGDDFGNIYISDQFNNRVRMLNSSGIITTVAGNGTPGFAGDSGLATLAELYKPTCTYIDGSGNIYIADQYNNRVREITTPIANTLSCSVSGNPFCACASFTVSYSATGIFNSGNSFTAQLSDSNGNFGSAVDIGSLQSTYDAGAIATAIPCNTPPCTSYRIRVISSNPTINGTDNGANLIINTSVVPSVAISASPSDTICPGASVVFTAIPVNGGTPFYQWKVNGSNASTGADTFTSSILNNADTVSCVMTSTANCASPDTVFSNLIIIATVDVNAGAISANPDTICAGTLISLTDAGSSGGTLQWQFRSSGTFSNIAGATKTSYTSAPLSQTTYFRVIVTNSHCTAVSDSLGITVIPPPAATFTFSVNGHVVIFNSAGSTGAIGYSWNFGDGSPLSSQPNPTHTYDSTKTYDVCLTVKNNSDCNFTSCQNVTTFSTGINSVIADGGLQVYPDPFHSDIFIAPSQGRINIETIEIYDVSGRKVFIRNAGTITGNPEVLDVSDLTEGMYYLVIKTVNGNYIQPLIKQ